MTMKRSGSAWMPADDYGRSLPKFSINLLVRDVQVSLPFYRDVLGATVRYADEDFAALNLAGAEFMLHADHSYDHHPLHKYIAGVQAGRRGLGAEFAGDVGSIPMPLRRARNRRRDHRSTGRRLSARLARRDAG